MKGFATDDTDEHGSIQIVRKTVHRSITDPDYSIVKLLSMDSAENISKLVLKDETFTIIGICMDVHSILGHGFLEVVYKDAIEHELLVKGITFEREKQYPIEFKGIVLPHKFYADFVVMGRIILEIKAAEGGLADAQISQTLNYLKASGCQVGLLVNFGRKRLEYKRLVF